MAYVPLRKAVAELGLHPNTLRRYADHGLISTIRNAAGQRLFDVDPYLRRAADASVVLYARVSRAKQRDDLARQVERLRLAYPHAEIVQDIGSGLNFKRKGLRALLERLLRGDKLRVVVAHRDRLARFGVDLIAFLVEPFGSAQDRLHGGELVVLDQPVEQSREAELTADLLAILHHFSCRPFDAAQDRPHGRRSHQGKTHQNLPDDGTEEPVSAVARNLKIRLQRNRQASRSSQGGTGGTLDGGGEDRPAEPAEPAGLGRSDPISDQEDRH